MMMSHLLAILFAPAKQGGILQSSGFLDLESLMALGQTCKAYMIDELSLIQLIENELTRNRHGVQSMEEAREFWRKVCRGDPLLRRWLKRDGTIVESTSIIVTREMLRAAVSYDVMLAKMLQRVMGHSGAECLLHTVNEPDESQSILLHHAARVGNAASIRAIVALYPSPRDQSAEQYMEILNQRDKCGWTALHFVAASADIDAVSTVLSYYPESHCPQVLVQLQSRRGTTPLHMAAHSCDTDLIRYALTLFPESEHFDAVCTPDNEGRTALHFVARSDRFEPIRTLLALLPESQRTQAANMENDKGRTLLTLVNEQMHERIMEFLLQHGQK